MRDIDADYEAAYRQEYAGYKAAGRDKDAARVAEILRTGYDVEVEPQQQAPEPAKEPETVKETAAAAPLPENTAEPAAPAGRGPAPRKAPAKKTAPAKPAKD